VVAEDKEYDGDREAVVALFDDRLNSDTLDITYTSALFDDKNAAENKIVTVLGISVGGSDAGNYLANTSASDTADITAKGLLIDITADDKVYDGSTEAVTLASIISGQVEGDAVTVTSSNGLFIDKNVGTDKVVTADVSTAGIDAGNYLANTSASDTADITAKGLLIDITADDKVYDGSPVAVTLASIISGLVEGDAVTVSSSNGLFADKNVGTDKTVSADVSTSGIDADNYLANTSATDSAEITAKGLFIDITADDKVYSIIKTWVQTKQYLQI
jgi:hypothetical protein